MSQSHTYVQQQAVNIKTLNTQQKILNRQLKQGKITQQEYNTQMAANKAQIQAITTQTQTLTLKQQIGIKVAKAWAIAQKMLLNIGLDVAINLIIAGITKAVNREKQSSEKLDKTSKLF